MDLCTNAGIISDAMKFVTKKREQIVTLHKLDEKIDTIEEETTATTNVQTAYSNSKPQYTLSYSFKPPIISAHIISA